MNDEARADVGVFGGSGFYEFETIRIATEPVEMDTPWGKPSAPVTIGLVGHAGDPVHPVRVAFLPRHGLKHEYPPHRVNYRANVDAMRQLGVRSLVAPFAAGSLRPDIKPGEFVVVDQLIDHTSGRASTFYDHFDDGPNHVSLAEPYDARLRQVLLHAAERAGITTHDGGTVVVVNGPRFSTRAESAWFRAMGADVVNMTQSPEAVLAREAGIAFAGIALVTDYDVGLADDPDIEPVTQDMVFDVFNRNLERLRDLLRGAIPALAHG